MNALVVPIQSPDTASAPVIATVKAHAGDRVLVEGPFGVRNARPAFSCLVRPEPGDRVLTSSTPDGMFVLSILERTSGLPVTLAVPESMAISAPNGAVHIQAGGEIGVISSTCAQVISPETRLTGEAVSIQAASLKAGIRKIEATAEETTFISDALNLITGRIVSHAKNVMRRVEEIEILNAGNLVQTIRKSFTSRSHHTIMTARDEMRIDGERINMG